ncbi:MAG: putative quinol monooxygenase [Sphingomonadales bacterium]
MGIAIIATAKFAPEHIEAVKEAAIIMVEETRKETGCMLYAFAQDVSDPTIIRIVEQWEDVSHLAAHMTVPHMAAFQAALAKTPPLSLEATRYDLATFGPLDVNAL